MASPVLVWLDVLLASVVGALFLSFATASRARESAEGMYRQWRIVRAGLLVAGTGIALLTAALALQALGNQTAGVPLQVYAIPVVVMGVTLVASATWRSPFARGAERP